MINLDDLNRMQQIDKVDMISEIDHLPDQILKAIDTAQKNTLPAWTGFENILISGMGGSAIAGDLLASYLADICPLPILYTSRLRNSSLGVCKKDPGDRLLAFRQHRRDSLHFRRSKSIGLQDRGGDDRW